jgi:hypothetical protein
MKILLTMAGLGSICFASQAITILGINQNPANGHTYALLSSATWTDSETYAQSLGGHLVTINDAAENAWVYNTFISLTRGATQPGLWIGLNDAAVEGSMRWASGEPVTYTHWYPGEPNNSAGGGPGGEDYVAMQGPIDPLPGTWNDLNNTAGNGVAQGNFFGVVEIVPEVSSTFALAGLAALGIVMFRKIKSNQTS